MTAIHTQATGFDRLVIGVSLSMLKWARKRADRATLSHEQHERLLSQQTHMQQREHDYSKRAARC